MRLLQWIKKFTISYAYTHSTVAPEDRVDIAQERAAFENRLANTEARLERLDIQGEIMEKSHGPGSD